MQNISLKLFQSSLFFFIQLTICHDAFFCFCFGDIDGSLKQHLKGFLRKHLSMVCWASSPSDLYMSDRFSLCYCTWILTCLILILNMNVHNSSQPINIILNVVLWIFLTKKATSSSFRYGRKTTQTEQNNLAQVTTLQIFKCSHETCTDCNWNLKSHNKVIYLQARESLCSSWLFC